MSDDSSADWREVFAATTIARVETAAELAGEAAATAVRQAAQLADAAGYAEETAELAQTEIELVAAMIVRHAQAASRPPRDVG